MAYSAYQYSGGILYPEHASQIVIDSSADLADIDLDVVAPGTRVVDCSSGSMYILSPSKQWKLVQNDVAAAANSVVKESVSGDIAVISDGADDVAVKAMTATITPVQSGSGDPSPTNVRPISGRTGLTVTRAGKNLCSGLHQGIINADGSYTAVTTRVTSAISAEYGTPVKAGTYTISSPDLDFCTAVTKNDNGTVVQSWAGKWNALPFTFTVNADSMLFFSCRKSDNSNIDPTAVFAQLESGSTATASVPYATTYPVTWETEAGTIYGGTLDVVSGVLTVDRAIVDISTLTWAAHDRYGFYSGRIRSTVKYPSGNNIPFDGISSIYKTVPLNQEPTTDYSVAVDSSGMLYIQDTRYSTAAEFISASSGVTICYPLATPQTYQLTPTEVRTLLGGNNIYTDAGEVSVEYVADTKLYIDNKIAELQALVLENN